MPSLRRPQPRQAAWQRREGQGGVHLHRRRTRGTSTGNRRLGQLPRPIGDPVRRGYSLYPWAVSQGRGIEFISAFLRPAFREGVNTNTTRGLRHVVESAGLPWNEAADVVGNDDWIPLIEANRQAMYSFGLWGVPSFRLLGADGEALVHAWGQDRLWLIAKEIQRALG